VRTDMLIKTILRRVMNVFGIDVFTYKKSPQITMLGLSSLDIRTIIDCGANEGQFASKISKVFPHANIYCFEPLQEPFNKLKSWAKKKNGKVNCFNFALGDYETEVQMYNHYEHSPSSSLLKSTKHCNHVYPQTKSQNLANVHVTTLDNILKDKLDVMDQYILLKLDVQGFEDKVLLGAPNILAASCACLLEINIDHLYEGQAKFIDLVEILNEADFSYAGNLEQSYGNDGRVIFLDAVFLKRKIFPSS